MSECQSSFSLKTLINSLIESINNSSNEIKSTHLNVLHQLQSQLSLLNQEISLQSQTLSNLQDSYKKGLKERTSFINMLNDDQIELCSFEKENCNILSEIVNLKLINCDLEKSVESKLIEIEFINKKIEKEDLEKSMKKESYRQRADFLRNKIGFDVEVVKKNVCRIHLIVLNKKCSFVFDFENNAVSDESFQISGNEFFRKSENFYDFVKTMRKEFKARILDR
ncbi:hypothetical protein GVAV_002083 [Gurleya vavrai]